MESIYFRLKEGVPVIVSMSLGVNRIALKYSFNTPDLFGTLLTLIFFELAFRLIFEVSTWISTSLISPSFSIFEVTVQNCLPKEIRSLSNLTQGDLFPVRRKIASRIFVFPEPFLPTIIEMFSSNPNSAFEWFLKFVSLIEFTFITIGN